jgi:hypothetical protein
MNASGRESTLSGRFQQSFHICVLERNPEALVEHWGSSGRAAESSGRVQAGAVQSFSTRRKVRMGIHVVRTDDASVWCASGWYDTSFGRLVIWTAGRPDGMTRRPDSWQGIEFFDFQTVQNFLETLLNSGIPVKKHHYNEVILSNKMWPITN